jgi:hypothetical protein
MIQHVRNKRDVVAQLLKSEATAANLAETDKS